MVSLPIRYIFPNMFGNQSNNLFHNMGKASVAMIVLFILFVAIQIIKKTIFIKDAVRAEGRITEIRKYSMGKAGNPRNHTLLYPVVEYKVSGLKITFESNIGTSITRLKVGDTVKVRYNPDNYEDADIDSFFRNWYEDIIMLVVNIFILIISCIIIGTIL